jgi:hypothetical protein
MTDNLGTTNATQPPPAPRDGRWVKLGAVSVDTVLIAICDPACVDSTYQPPMAMFDEGSFSHPYGQISLGVQFSSGLGDGNYDVWGWIIDCGKPFGERVAQVAITMVVDE